MYGKKNHSQFIKFKIQLHINNVMNRNEGWQTSSVAISNPGGTILTKNVLLPTQGVPMILTKLLFKVF